MRPDGTARHGMQNVRGSNPLSSTKFFEQSSSAKVLSVAARARSIAPAVGSDAGLLEAVAWLRDTGYLLDRADIGLHSPDGALYLRDVQHAEPCADALADAPDHVKAKLYAAFDIQVLHRDRKRQQHPGHHHQLRARLGLLEPDVLAARGADDNRVLPVYRDEPPPRLGRAVRQLSRLLYVAGVSYCSEPTTSTAARYRTRRSGPVRPRAGCGGDTAGTGRPRTLAVTGTTASIRRSLGPGPRGIQ
jgi:hypothetical protein